MKKLILLTTAFVMGLVLVVSAQPGPGGSMCKHDGLGMNCDKMCGGPGMMHGRGGMMAEGPGLERILEMADKLELTDAQRDVGVLKVVQMGRRELTAKIDGNYRADERVQIGGDKLTALANYDSSSRHPT